MQIQLKLKFKLYVNKNLRYNQTNYAYIFGDIIQMEQVYDKENNNSEIEILSTEINDSFRKLYHH